MLGEGFVGGAPFGREFGAGTGGLFGAGSVSGVASAAGGLTGFVLGGERRGRKGGLELGRIGLGGLGITGLVVPIEVNISREREDGDGRDASEEAMEEGRVVEEEDDDCVQPD